MSTGELWAARFATISGTFLWGFGAVLHVQFFVVILGLIGAVANGDYASFGGLAWIEGLAMAGAFLSGPVLTAVGGGMRFFAGIMTGSVVTGRLASKIVRFAWLRYECTAAGIGAGLTGLFYPLGHGQGPVLALAVFAGGIVLAVVLFGWGWTCNRIKNDLMWQVRQDGIGSGMVPYPKGAVPPTDR